MAWVQPSVNASVVVLGSREGYEATAQCPFGKSQVLCFYKPLFFHIPPNPPFSQKERALPRKTTNPELLSRVFIQQTLRAVVGLAAVPGWGHIAVFSLVTCLIRDTPCSQTHRNPRAVWPRLD